MMATSYSFPVFSNKDIAEFFTNEMNPPIRVTEADLKTIKAPLVMRLYAGLWEAIMDKDLDSVCQPQFDPGSDYPDTHDSFIQLATFAKVLRWLLNVAGAGDFLIGDLRDPKPRRTNKFLSALMNYYLFVRSRIEIYHELKANKEEEEERLSALRDANDALQRQIDDLKHDRAEQGPESARLGEEAEKLESHLNELVLQKRDLVQKVTDVQGKVVKANENTERGEEQLVKKREEVTNMDQQIIQSPERMTVEIENMVEKKTKVRSQQGECQARLIEMERKMKDEDRFLKDTEAALKIVKEFTELLQKEASLIEVGSDLEASVGVVLKRCTELGHQLDALDQEGEYRQQKHQRAMGSRQVRINSLKADIQARERALADLKETAELKKSQYQSRLRDVENIQRHGDRQISEEKQKLDVMKAKYAELLEAMDKYHTRLAAQHRTVTDTVRHFMAETSKAWDVENNENSPDNS